MYQDIEYHKVHKLQSHNFSFFSLKKVSQNYCGVLGAALFVGQCFLNIFTLF